MVNSRRKIAINGCERNSSVVGWGSSLLVSGDGETIKEGRRIKEVGGGAISLCKA